MTDVQNAVTGTMNTKRMEVARLRVAIAMRLKHEFLDAIEKEKDRPLEFEYFEEIANMVESFETVKSMIEVHISGDMKHANTR